MKKILCFLAVAALLNACRKPCQPAYIGEFYRLNAPHGAPLTIRPDGTGEFAQMEFSWQPIGDRCDSIAVTYTHIFFTENLAATTNGDTLTLSGGVFFLVGGVYLER